MKWWQSGRGVDSRPTKTKAQAARTPGRPRPSSSRTSKLLFVLSCDVNFFFPITAAAFSASLATSSSSYTVINYTLGVWERKTIRTCSSTRLAAARLGQVKWGYVHTHSQTNSSAYLYLLFVFGSSISLALVLSYLLEANCGPFSWLPTQLATVYLIFKSPKLPSDNFD